MPHQPALILKRGTAAKTGPRSTGGLQYQILTNESRSELFIMITGNDGGGYFSTERVSFTAVGDCLKSIKTDSPFPAKTFKAAFKGKSANNSGFMAAILRTEGLLSAAPESPSQHLRTGDWNAWTAELLKQPGESYVPPAPEAPETAAKEAIASKETPKADAVRAKRKGGKAPEEKQLPSSEGDGNADHPA